MAQRNKLYQALDTQATIVSRISLLLILVDFWSFRGICGGEIIILAALSFKHKPIRGILSSYSLIQSNLSLLEGKNCQKHYT